MTYYRINQSGSYNQDAFIVKYFNECCEENFNIFRERIGKQIEKYLLLLEGYLKIEVLFSWVRHEGHDIVKHGSSLMHVRREQICMENS